MSRPSGFTDAELAAAAWRRNMNNKGTLKEETEVRKADRKSERKKKKKRRERHALARKSGRRKSKSSTRRGDGRGTRDRSASMGSVDSLGRERKRVHDRSPGSADSRSPERRRRSRRRKRAKNEELSEAEKAFGWRGAMARASRSPSGSSDGSGGRRSWSTASSQGGSVSSDRGTDGESDADPDAGDESRGYEGAGAGLLGMAADVPSDPRRPDHDDRHERWRGGRQSKSSVGMMAKGRGVNGGSASALSDWDRHQRNGRGRRRDLDERDFDREDRGMRRSSPGRRGRSRSPGDGGVARSLSRSISRDRRSRRSSRSRSPSYRRSRSRDRAVSSLLKEFSRKSSSDGAGTGGDERRADLVRTWTHDLYDETKEAESPPRPSLPPGYKPEPESWVSRAGGVYVPLKPT